MRRFSFKLCVALLTFAFGVYAALLWQAFAPRLPGPPPPPAARPAPARPAEPPAVLCEVHRAAMRTERVPVHYGTPVNAAVRYEAERRLFPNSRRFVLGGCEVKDESHRELHVCEACRAAEAEWRRQNPNEW